MHFICNLLSAFLKPQFLTIVVALISYFVDKIKDINNDNNYYIASSKSTIDYALPAHAKKNKEQKTENYIIRRHALDLMWSFKFHIMSKQDQVNHFVSACCCFQYHNINETQRM